MRRRFERLEKKMTVTANDDLAFLIERAKERDPRAFEELVDRYSSRLYGFVYRLTGQREEAEDLVQEVFTRLVRTIDGYSHDGRFEAWLFRVATNLARDRLRRLKRSVSLASSGGARDEDRDDSSSSLHALADLSTPPPETPMRLREDVDRLQKALAKLPATEREVIMLRHYTDMSFAEIAQAMGTPLGTALARSHRGLAKLRKWMEDTP